MAGAPLTSLPQPRPSGVRELLELPLEERQPYLDHLLPPDLKEHYGLPWPPSWNLTEHGLYRLIELPDPGAVRVEVWPEPDGEDPALVVELTETYYGQLEASWLVLNDVRGPRYSLDRDERGNPLPLGSWVRNLRQEIRALHAGLAPNQVRPGLRMFRPLIQGIEDVAEAFGIGILYVAPLAYHNAIKYEKYGFTYASGREEMEWIHREFGPGGVLRKRMDGSRPFRLPWMADTVRGRSWAIHDGLLGRRWMAPQMYKFVGRSFSTCTFPQGRW